MWKKALLVSGFVLSAFIAPPERAAAQRQTETQPVRRMQPPATTEVEEIDAKQRGVLVEGAQREPPTVPATPDQKAKVPNHSFVVKCQKLSSLGGGTLNFAFTCAKSPYGKLTFGVKRSLYGGTPNPSMPALMQLAVDKERADHVARIVIAFAEMKAFNPNANVELVVYAEPIGFAGWDAVTDSASLKFPN